MPFILLLKSPIFRGAVVAAIVAAVLGWSYMAVHSRGVAACERDHLLSDAANAEAAHQVYLAEVERGDKLSKQLNETQRRLNETKAEYLTFANAITGNCSGSVRLLAHYAAKGEPLPEATSPSNDPSDAVSASAIAENIAENYARCHLNAAQLNALIQ